ncbi:MAG: HPF/RaiA family ribosome-associated protein [Planctomycetota bacterium]
MRVDVRVRRGEVTEEIHAHAERSVQFAFTRLGNRVSAVTVTLHDVNGPKGGIDKQCQIRVLGDHLADIVVTQADARWRAAIDVAVDRASRLVSRKLDRFRGSSLSGEWT